MIVALAVTAVAVIAGVVLVFVLTGDDDKSESAGGGNSTETSAGKATIPGGNAPGGGTGGSTRPGRSTSTSGGSSGSSGSNSAGDGPRALAQRAADAIEQQDISEIDSVACTPTVARELKTGMAQVPSGATATVGDVRETGNQAVAALTISMGGQSERITMEMKKDGSKWCITGV